MLDDMTDDWSDEETEDPLVADTRNFSKVEKWTRDGAKAPAQAKFQGGGNPAVVFRRRLRKPGDGSRSGQQAPNLLDAKSID